MLAALLTLALLVGIFKLLAPSASASLKGWFPGADRGVDRHITGQTEHRGAVLAALAAANIAGATGGALLLGIASAVCFRLRPKPTAVVLGFVGVLFALRTALGESCVAPVEGRRALALALSVMGLAAFVALRFVFSGAAFARGSVSPLVVFGLIQLATFVAAPFGTALTDTVGLGRSLAAVVALYGLVVVAAALLPDFTASVIGAALLAATLSVDTVVGDRCTGVQGTVLVTLLVFAAAWWAAGAVAGRRR